MEGSTGSDSVDKPWDHAWSTEEMRKNRRDWSLAGDSGLLKHLQQFSENLTKKANETQEAIDSMTSKLNQTAILVDNITNTSLALANTQFIESRVQEDNAEIEQPVESIKKDEDEHEFSATDLLVSVCESIRQGLSIMDEKYEKVEVVASDSEDEDDNAVPSVILRPKDPYQDRPLPYVIGTEQWKSSNKIGLESSSSESEQNDDDEDSASDTDDKNIGSMLNPNARMNLGIGRLSSTSSESNDYNVESSSIKDTDNSRLHARSQDTLNSDTEPTTPSSVLPKTQNINNGPPSFAEELAKRLGNVLPAHKNTIAQGSNEQVINRSKDEMLTSEEDQDVFSNKSDNLFNEGKNLFSDEVSSSSWKNKPIRPVNKNIIPPSIDVPPPLSNFSSAPKSTIDDLFGDADDSEDSDDIFSKKASKDIFAAEREKIRSEVASTLKNPRVENVQNISTMTTSTPEANDKAKGLFEDEEDDDLFGSVTKQIKTPDTSSSASSKKKPVGGVSIFGKVDILSSSKFARRPSSSSSSESDSSDHRVSSNASENATGQSIGSATTSKSNSSSGANVSSSIEAGNNVNERRQAGNNTDSSGSSGVSVRQPSSDFTVGSSLGSGDLMSSTRLKSEEIYNRERVPSDSLFVGRTSDNRTNESADQQQQQQREQPSSLLEDVSEQEDVFGPPPLPKSNDASRQKSKVASLFDDSDSGDDLFSSASPGSRSLRSSERTPSKTTTTSQNQPQPKSKGLFDDDDDLFGPKDAPDVDLFGSAPAKSSSKAGLFDDVADGGLFEKPKEKNKAQVSSLFGEAKDPLFGESSKKSSEKESKGLFKEPAKVDKLPEKKKPAVSSKGLFEDPEDGDLFANVAKPAAASEKSSSFKSIFEDTSDSDLFGSSSKNILDKNVVVEKSSDSLFGESKGTSDLFDTKGTKTPEEKSRKKEPSPKDVLEEKPKEQAKPKKLTTSIFDDSDDDEDLFGSVSKKSTSSNYSSLFGSDKSISVAKKMKEEKKIETEKAPEKKLEEPPPVSVKPKVSEKSSIFDDDDDDDDDLFGEKKRKKEPSESDKSAKDEAKKTTESKTKTEGKPEIASKKAIFAEIKQKLEKHKLEQTEGRPVKSDSSVVDGAVISKKEPPKTLKIQMPTTEESSTSSSQQPLKKPVVSGKIKNLMGKMGDLKILSPTDTPPLFRKNNEEKSSGSNEDEQEAAGDLASSEASTPSLLSGGSSPQTSGTNSRARDSPSLKSDNTEVAISFDEPAQVETLASTASKSRARIPAKRRPQSRQARQSALRHSGIDFDIVDASSTSPTIDKPNGDVHLDVDRLLPSGRTEALERSSRQESGAHTDDKSEISASRNTTGNLLSPSTDEEDLFDVPPDLPEDPAATEESLFGRAPILSPIEPVVKPSSRRKAEPTKKESESANKTKERRKEEEKKEVKEEPKSDAPLDPLRDDSHDPLKDPSSLFAFVTKTPSPEKNQGLLLNEDDDSLFSSSSKSADKPSEKKSKPGLDLFIDDDDDTSSNDLFSSSKVKIKKPLKDTKIDLFDDVAAEDDDDSLFGSVTKKSELKKSKESSSALSTVPSAAPKVVEKKESTSKVDTKKQSKIKTATKDIFDNSSDDDDIFAGSKKTIPKKKSKSLFDDDEDDADDDDIFGKPKSSSTKNSKAVLNKDRPVIKKAVTRDLKKTAEKIVEDPLSMLQDD